MTGATRTFYVLDLDLFGPEEFQEGAFPVVVHAVDGADLAAERWALGWGEVHDGATGRCLVAEDPGGTNARQFSVRCRVELSFTVTEVRS